MPVDAEAPATAAAQDVTSVGPELEAFAREMIACGHKHVALGILEPGSRSLVQVAAEGRVYTAAARSAAGDAFVDREAPNIRETTHAEIQQAVESRRVARMSRANKRECDARLARYASSEASR